MAKLKENSMIVKVSGEELIATEPKVLSMIQDNAYVHPATHPASMITGLHESATTGVAGSVAWGNVTGKPSTFAPSSHSHGAGDLPSATTSAKGVVQLSSAVNSTSTTLAATASAVKSAYDLANSKWAYNEATIKAVKVNSAGTADTLATARTINGTSFDGSANITTANWGTARTLTIGSTGKSVNGSSNVSWTLAEIGAAPASHTHTASQVGLGNVQNYGIATQAQAEAGTANDVYMTPLRVAQTIQALGGEIKIAYGSFEIESGISGHNVVIGFEPHIVFLMGEYDGSTRQIFVLRDTLWKNSTGGSKAWCDYEGFSVFRDLEYLDGWFRGRWYWFAIGE